MYHIPICPFSQRVAILLSLKSASERIGFEVVDITVPRPKWLLEKSGGATAMPILEVAPGKVIKESLVILRYVEDCFATPPIARRDLYERAIEDMLIAQEGAFVRHGYRFVMNQDRDRRAKFAERMLSLYADLDAFLTKYNPEGVFLFERFGMAEVVFTPFFMRFGFLEYYERFELPVDDRFERVRRWRQACLANEHAQQVTHEEVVKIYYDYAQGAGNGALVEGRQRSTFAFEPHWSERPWPPRDKYCGSASDGALGLTHDESQ